MMDVWLPGCKTIPITNHGYGPFATFLGVVLHVNASNGNLANFFQNSQDVTPNFQVYKDGSIEQYLPLSWQPWCQTDGNQNYAAIETEGYPTEALTPAQLQSVQNIVAQYHSQLGMPLQLADSPGQRGFGWHGMGGNAWGGHPGCPGDLRKAQRSTILANLTQGDDMSQADVDAINAHTDQLGQVIVGTGPQATRPNTLTDIGTTLDGVVSDVATIKSQVATILKFLTPHS